MIFATITSVRGSPSLQSSCSSAHNLRNALRMASMWAECGRIGGRGNGEVFGSNPSGACASRPSHAIAYSPPCRSSVSFVNRVYHSV
jgi:hypothetical protein